METINCILCGQAGDRVVIVENGFQGRRCDACGVIFISPRPSRAEIATIYAADTAHVSSAGQVRPSAGARLHARLTLNLLRRHRARGRLVEIGAGGGHFAVAARTAGYDVSATEMNPVDREQIRSLGIPCSESIDAECDIVYARDVLSHFYDPASELKTIHSHLRPTGLLVLETGNLGDVDERYLSCFNRFQYPDHLFFFGEGALRRLLAGAGFRVVAVHRYGILPSLWVLRMKERFVTAAPGREASRSAGPSPARGGWKRDALGVVLHLVQYPLGRLLARRGRPQTIIVVAEKID